MKYGLRIGSDGRVPAAEVPGQFFGLRQFAGQRCARKTDRKSPDGLFFETAEQGQENRRVHAAGQKQAEGYIRAHVLPHHRFHEPVELFLRFGLVHCNRFDRQGRPVLPALAQRPLFDADRLARQEALTALENRFAFRAELVLQVFDQSGRVDLRC